MAKFIEVYMAGRKHLQFTHDDVTIDVYSGDPPGTAPGVPRVLMNDEVDIEPDEEAAETVNGSSNFYAPTKLPSPLNAVAIEPAWEAGARDEPENA